MLRNAVFPRRLLGPDHASADTGDAVGRLASATTTIETLQPEAFLAEATGAPRGFWQSGQRWSATAGSLIELVEPGHAHLDAPGTNGQAPDDGHRPHRIELAGTSQGHRFQALATAARALQRDHAVPGPQGSQPELRFFGGAAFHPDHAGQGPWSAFPATWFSLPALRLSHRPAGTKLTATVHLPAGTPDDEARQAAADALEVAKQRLAETKASIELHPASPVEVEAPDGRSQWTTAVDDALSAIRAGKLGKVVLARILHAACQADQDPLAVLARLRSANPGTHRFLVEPAPGHVFLGAAPELVAQVTDDRFHAAAVAGSIARGDDATTDDELSRRLLASDKDRAEHRLVVDHMRERLMPLADQIEVARQPGILRLAGIQHLETDLRARLTPGTGVLDALAAMHATPAVCGTPPDEAQAFLKGHEPFDRGWYAGPVGWFDTSGDGAFAPGLRSAVRDGTTWTLYAGAGIVPGSEADSEWEETRIKFEPVLRALGSQAEAGGHQAP